MQPIKFDEMNHIIGATQPQYMPLPAHVVNAPEVPVVSCWELDAREKAVLLRTGRIWHSVYTFGRPYPPMRLQVENPFAADGENEPRMNTDEHGSKPQTYSFSRDEERFEGTFDSPERAAEEAFEEDKNLDFVWVGRNVVPPRRINEEHVIDDVITSTTDESGDWSDGYLMNVPKAAREDLRGRLQKAWDEWEKANGMEPTWWNVEDVRVIRREDLA